MGPPGEFPTIKQIHFKKSSMAISATHVGTEEKKKTALKVYGQTNNTSHESPQKKNS
jgi:hypothetical protein